MSGRLTHPFPLLTARLPVQVALGVLIVLAPLVVWGRGASPALFGVPADSPWIPWLAGTLGALLFLLPVAWILASRIVDLLALALAQQALILAGYFFLNTTAWKLTGQGWGILHSAPLVVVFNAVGFAVFLTSLGVTYLFAVLTHARLGALNAPPAAYDARLRGLLLAVGLLAGAVIALPMAVSGTIPMLAADPVAARFAMIQSDAARALYHMGTALLPFVVGGLAVFILREPTRAFSIEGMLSGGIVVLQILTSNRLPLAITLLVTATLLCMERRFPRWLLLVTFAGYIVLFAGLSGFTSILRQDRSALEGRNVVEASLSEAFLGDNLIDLRDAAWVFSHWDGDPLLGRTYLGGLVAMVPSGVFPLKKEWHLGLTGVRIVGWDPEKHFGLRITFFGEAFLNFGWLGVIGLGVIMGCLFGVLLRRLHLASRKRPCCLTKNFETVLFMQMALPLANTSDAFTTWSMLALLAGVWIWVELPLRLRPMAAARPAFLPSHG